MFENFSEIPQYLSIGRFSVPAKTNKEIISVFEELNKRGVVKLIANPELIKRVRKLAKEDGIEARYLNSEKTELLLLDETYIVDLTHG